MWDKCFKEQRPGGMKQQEVYVGSQTLLGFPESLESEANESR